MQKHSDLFFSAINQANNILILFPNNYDGDAVASSVALSNIFQKTDKNFSILNEQISLPESFKFLPMAEKITQQLKTLQTPLDKDHDLVIAINTQSLLLLKNMINEPALLQTPIINIDHNPKNESFGTLNIISDNVSSSSEIIYDLIKFSTTFSLDTNIATCLLAGMVHKTKRFKSPDIASATISNFQKLVADGAEKDKIFSNLYRNKTVQTLKLWSKVLRKLKTDQNQTLAWATIQTREFEETNGHPEDLVNITNELLHLVPTLRFILFHYCEQNAPTAMILTNQKHNLLRTLAEFQPHGSDNLVKIFHPDMQKILCNLKQVK